MNPGLADGRHTALEGGVLDRVRVLGDDFEIPKDYGDENHKEGEKKGYY